MIAAYIDQHSETEEQFKVVEPGDFEVVEPGDFEVVEPGDFESS